jgi:hypothetical protein
MRRTACVLAVAAMAGVSGCAALLIGAGAAGGYAISQDSVKNHFGLSAPTVFRASRDVMRELGLITLEDERHGVIKGTVQGANVTINVKPLTAKTVQLKVKARDDLLFPKIDIAQAVYTRILEQLPK